MDAAAASAAATVLPDTHGAPPSSPQCGCSSPSLPSDPVVSSLLALGHRWLCCWHRERTATSRVSLSLPLPHPHMNIVSVLPCSLVAAVSLPVWWPPGGWQAMAPATQHHQFWIRAIHNKSVDIGYAGCVAIASEIPKDTILALNGSFTAVQELAPWMMRISAGIRIQELIQGYMNRRWRHSQGPNSTASTYMQVWLGLNNPLGS